MSDASRAWTWRHAITRSSLPATTRHVLLTISCFMNDVGGGCYPTTKQLAEATGLSERAVCEHIGKAKSAGWLAVSEHGFRGQKWKNHEYRAAWPIEERTDPPSVPSSKGTDPDDKKALTLRQSTSPDTTPISIQGARASTPRGELLAVLDAEHADAVVEHRQRIRKPLTAYAAKLLAKKFAKVPDPHAAADAMIANGWQGFEPSWLEDRGRNSRQAQNRPGSLCDLAAERLQSRAMEGNHHVIDHAD